MSRWVDFVTLDVFTAAPFSGNPLAVVFLPDNLSKPLSQSQKQEIAKEFNYSETIFIHPVAAASPTKRPIDIFMTDQEPPFVGHPTVGAASWLLCLSPKEHPYHPVDTIITKAGEIPISRPSTLQDVVSISVPYDAHTHKAQFPLSELLRLHPSLVPAFSETGYRKTKSFPVFSVVKGVSQIFVELPSLSALGSLAPGSEVVTTKSSSQGGYLDDGWNVDGVLVLYFYVRDVWDDDTKKTVIRTRLIHGSLEDAATGSAASGLAAYLSLVDSTSTSSSYDYDIIQGVEMGRRSEIGAEARLSEDGKSIKSLKLRGSAVKISEGKFLVKEER
jgi:PhzF family phenazine biosynthesis protein